MLENQIDRLAQLLRNAAEEHHKYETASGKTDPDWPAWYAAYLASHDVAILTSDARSLLEDTHNA